MPYVPYECHVDIPNIPLCPGRRCPLAVGGAACRSTGHVLQCNVLAEGFCMIKRRTTCLENQLYYGFHASFNAHLPTDRWKSCEISCLHTYIYTYICSVRLRYNTVVYRMHTHGIPPEPRALIIFNASTSLFPFQIPVRVSAHIWTIGHGKSHQPPTVLLNLFSKAPRTLAGISVITGTRGWGTLGGG